MASTEALAEAALGAGDLEGAQALVEQAGWNQVKADWQVFLELGRAFAVKPAQGRLAATAAVLPYPSGFGWISMVLVDQAYRRRGIATRLLEHCMKTLEHAGMVPVLDATPAGREVYKPLGFRDGWPIQRWRRTGGDPSPSALHGATAVRAMEDRDWPAVLALDASAFGCDRAPLLERLRERSRRFACVAERGGRLQGFLLGRDGRVATQIGPVIADDEAVAAALAAWAAACVPSPVIVDALERHASFAAWLATHGFQKERPYTRMALGRDTLFGEPARTMAIAGPELG
jgi:GNAT superfamily N-acetyltransferase